MAGVVYMFLMRCIPGHSNVKSSSYSPHEHFMVNSLFINARLGSLPMAHLSINFILHSQYKFGYEIYISPSLFICHRRQFISSQFIANLHRTYQTDWSSDFVGLTPTFSYPPWKCQTFVVPLIKYMMKFKWLYPKPQQIHLLHLYNWMNITHWNLVNIIDPNISSRARIVAMRGFKSLPWLIWLMLVCELIWVRWCVLLLEFNAAMRRYIWSGLYTIH
jgi:hypothetical protein